MRRCRKHTQAVVRYGMPPKTPLEPAGRHVAEAKAAIDRQREMIRAINAAEQSTELVSRDRLGDHGVDARQFRV